MPLSFLCNGNISYVNGGIDGCHTSVGFRGNGGVLDVENGFNSCEVSVDGSGFCTPRKRDLPRKLYGKGRK